MPPPIPTRDLTGLPYDTSFGNVISHIESIKSQVNIQLSEVENLQTSRATLKRKIDKINEQIPEAEQGHVAKKRELDKAKKECSAAQNIVVALRVSAEEFAEKCKTIEDQEFKKTRDLQQSRDLLRLLGSMKKAAEEAELARAKNFECAHCGLEYLKADKIKHWAKCWGRCKHCKEKRLACNCGVGLSFSRCGNCARVGRSCEKLAGTRSLAKTLSILVSKSTR